MNPGTSAFACLAGMTLTEIESAERRLSALPPYEPADMEIAECMMGRGGAFMKQLGRAFVFADAANRRKIKETWPAEWARYRASVIPPERPDFGEPGAGADNAPANNSSSSNNSSHNKFGAAA